MKSTITATAIVAATLLAAAAYLNVEQTATRKHQVPLASEMKFKSWMTTHEKEYNSPSEYQYRLEIFHKKLLKIEEVNSSQNDYEFGINKFSDLTSEEFVAKYTDGGQFSEASEIEMVELPEGQSPAKQLSQSSGGVVVDWRRQGYVGPIRDAGECQAYYSFAAVDAIEFSYAQRTGGYTELSKQQIIDCAGGYLAHGCSSGSTLGALKYVIAKGLATEINYPYVQRTQNCNYNPQTAAERVRHWYGIRPYSGNQLESAVNHSVVSVKVNARYLQDYKGGIYTGSCSPLINNSCSIVGYGSQDGVDYWIVRMSYGTGYGINGYLKIQKILGALNSGKCGINSLGYWATWNPK